VEAYDMGDIKNKDRERSIPWVKLVESRDPSIYTRPVTTYVFDNGNRRFYKPRNKNGN